MPAGKIDFSVDQGFHPFRRKTQIDNFNDVIRFDSQFPLGNFQQNSIPFPAVPPSPDRVVGKLLPQILRLVTEYAAYIGDGFSCLLRPEYIRLKAFFRYVPERSLVFFFDAAHKTSSRTSGQMKRVRFVKSGIYDLRGYRSLF